MRSDGRRFVIEAESDGGRVGAARHCASGLSARAYTITVGATVRNKVSARAGAFVWRSRCRRAARRPVARLGRHSLASPVRRSGYPPVSRAGVSRAPHSCSFLHASCSQSSQPFRLSIRLCRGSVCVLLLCLVFFVHVFVSGLFAISPSSKGESELVLLHRRCDRADTQVMFLI